MECLNIMLEGNVGMEFFGTECWNIMLEQNFGTDPGHEMLEQNVGAKVWI